MYRATKAINNSGNVMGVRAAEQLEGWISHHCDKVAGVDHEEPSDVDDDKQAACDDGDRPRMCAKR
jgi:hypothetical protein